MNYFTKTVMVVLLVFVGWSTIYAQELLSDVVNIGSNQKYIIAETTDGPYIITINTQDSVKVYKIEGESATLQYANYFISISGEYYIYSKGDFMFLSTPEGAVAYDFVADEQYLFPYSGELIRSQWYTYSSSNADQVKLSMTSSNYSPRVYSIFDLKSKEMVPFEHVDNIRHIHNDFYVLEEYINEDTTIISIYDRESEAIVEEFLPYPYSLSIHNDEVLYFKDNNLLRYDFYAGEDEIIYELEDGIDPSIRAAILENHYILSYRINSEEISVIIDKETHESWACDYYIKEFKYEEVNNQLILSDYTDILLYDLDTRSSTILETNSRIQDVSIIKDRYLLHNYTYILGTNVVAVNALYDTHDGTSTDVGGDKVYASFLRPEVIDIDGGSLINFSTNLASDHELLYYDEEDHTVFPSHIVPAAPLGILNDSELFLSHEDIILGNNQNIYAVLQDSISELTGEYYNKSYSDLHHVGEVGLFWAEVTSQNFSFYTYKDGVKSHVGTITADDIEGGFYPASLDHYYITEESIYFSAFKFTEKRLYRYSRTDESVEIMMDLESFSRDQFIGALSETVYYENEGLLYVLRPGEDIENLSVPGYPHLILRPYVFFDHSLFIAGTDGIYKVNGNTAIKDLSLENDPGFLNLGVRFNVIGDKLLLGSDSNFSYIYTNGTWEKYDFFPARYYSVFDDNHLYVTREIEELEYESTLYNLETQEYLELPEEVKKKSLVKKIRNFDKDFVITFSGSFPQYTVTVYEVNDSYTEWDEIDSFETNSRGDDVNWESYENEGFLYAGTRMFLMKEDLHFVPLEKITGDPELVKIIEEDGYFYFVAIHPEKGRQVFRVQAFSERTGTHDIYYERISVYPNPTGDVLNVNLEDIDRWSSYEIYNLMGQLMQKGVMTDGDILVEELNQGKYIILIHTEGEVKMSKFMKF